MSVDIEPRRSVPGAAGHADPLTGVREPVTPAPEPVVPPVPARRPVTRDPVATEPRRRCAVVAAAGLALGAMLAVAGLLPDEGAPRATAQRAPSAPSAPRVPPVDPRYDSGPIGPWQQMGHAIAADALAARVAADDRGVLLLGDSLAARVHPALAPRLAAARHPLTWNHWNGRPTHGAVDALVALDGQGRQPRTLVVLSGANDIFDPAGFPREVERLLATAGDRRVHWVTPRVERRGRAEPDLYNSRIVDEALAAAAARHPNLRLVPWAEYLAARGADERRRLVPDGVHPSPAGAAVLAGLIADSVG